MAVTAVAWAVLVAPLAALAVLMRTGIEHLASIFLYSKQLC